MTALIDIVFLLLIYFLLTTNYLTSNTLPLELPATETALPQDAQVLTISLDVEGGMYLAGRAVAENELATHLCSALANNGSYPVVIRSDGRVELGRVVEVVDLARGCGAATISLATDNRNMVR